MDSNKNGLFRKSTINTNICLCEKKEQTYIPSKGYDISILHWFLGTSSSYFMPNYLPVIDVRVSITQ